MSKPVYQILRNVVIVKTTDKAYLINFKSRNLWLPISLVSSLFPDYGRGTIDMVVPVWYAEKNGLIY
jgi:hypothetical protein